MKVKILIKTSLLAGVCAVAMSAANSAANAANQTWNPGGAGGGSGPWNANNWDSAAAWTSGNTAVFGGTAGTVTSTSQTVSGLTFNTAGYILSPGTLTLTGAPTTFATSFANATDTAILNSVVLANGSTAATITKTGKGTLALNAATSSLGGTTPATVAAWTVTGGTLSGTQYDSILSITGGNNLGNNPNGAVQLILDAGTVITTGAFNAGRNIQVNAAGGTLLENVSGIALAGTLTNNADSGHTLYVGVMGSFASSISGIISGGGSLTNTETGTLTLSGTNTYTGGTTVSAGTLKAGNAAALGNANNTLTVNGGTLDMGSFSFGVGNFTGTGGTVLNSTNATNVTLTIGNNNATGGSFAGVIANNGGGAATGTVALQKTGSGTLTLTGTNTYTGATTIGSGGALQLGDGTSGHDGTIANTSGITDNGTLIYNRFGSLSSSTVISGSGAVTKTGGGTLALTGANTYSGLTTVSVGTLLVSNTTGSGTGTGSVSVASGAILGGTGTIAPGTGNSISVSGQVAPGSAGSIGTLTINSLSTASTAATFASGATFAFDLNTTGLQSDKLSLINGAAGDFQFNSNNIAFTVSGTLASGQTYTIFTADVASAYGGLTFTGSKVTAGLSISGLGGAYDTNSYIAKSGNDLVLNVVPEPTTWALLAGSLTVVTVFRRRRS